MVKILLALNDEETRHFLDTLITTNFNCSLIMADDGAKAIEYTFKGKPDLIILDVSLSKISGLKVLERIRNAKEFTKTPVVIVTSSRDKETIRKIIELDILEFLLWPIDPIMILEKLRIIINEITEIKEIEEAVENSSYYRYSLKPLSILQILNKIKQEELLFQESLKTSLANKINVVIIDKDKRFGNFFAHMFQPWFNVLEISDVVTLVDVLRRKNPEFIFVDERIKGIGEALRSKAVGNINVNNLKIIKLKRIAGDNSERELEKIRTDLDHAVAVAQEEAQDESIYTGTILKCYSPSSLITEFNSYSENIKVDYNMLYNFVKRHLLFSVINSVNQACEIVLKEVVLYCDEKVANLIPAQAESVVEFNSKNEDIQIITSLTCDQKDLLVVASKIMGGPIENVGEVPVVFSRLLEKVTNQFLPAFQKMGLDVSSTRAKFYINKDAALKNSWDMKIPVELMGGYRILFRIRWIGFL